MTEANDPINVALLAMPEVTASTLYGMHDLFSSAGRDWDFIVNGSPGPSKMRPYVVSRERDGFLAANDVWVKPNFGLDDCPPPAIVCIPDFFVNPSDRTYQGHPIEAAWLKALHQKGTMLCSACSGGVLLAQAGLLDGCEATIHWGYADFLRNNYENVRVLPERALILSGETRRVIMAGGGTNWQDLALYLIGRYCGLKTAIEVAKTYMLGWHDIGQQPFANLTAGKRSNDGVIAEAQQWLAYHYNVRTPVTAIVEKSGVPERSFKRRFSQSTGMSPMAYVHALRLEEAKQLLETTDSPLEMIASEIGYEDTGFFTRLFKKNVGVTPAVYRRRFGALRKILIGQRQA